MTTETIRETYVTALRNAHAMEQQALQIMQRQVERIEHYPDMSKALTAHIKETETQRQRLESALADVGEEHSSVKEGIMGFFGNMAAIAHVPANDEVLKNSLANHAFENYEIAAYTTLIAIAKQAGHSQFVPQFETSLAEEQAMAKTVFNMIEPTTTRYLDLAGTQGFSEAKI